MNRALRVLSVFAAAALAAMTTVAHAQQNAGRTASSFDKSSGGSGQAFPTKPIRFVVPFSPGGGSDTLTRIIARKSMLVVTPSLGVRMLKDFIELARSRPGKTPFSSGGAGSSLPGYKS